MSKGINVLSLFDGKSSGYTALELAEIPVNNYYSSEIDKYAIQVSNAIHPNQIRLGDVTKWREWSIDWSTIDLVLGGFPCQAWSMAGKQLGDKDERGMLFWVMLDIMKEVRKYNPKADFLIENVKMKKEFEEYITYHTEQALGEVHKTLINSALVSAQNRNRYYWTSFKVEQPVNTNQCISKILEVKVDKKFNVSETQIDRLDLSSVGLGGARVCFQSPGQNINKSECLQARDYKGISGRQYFTVAMREQGLTKLTPRECFRLQTVPEHYIDKILTCGVSNSQLYKIAGNGWTYEVIAHIFREMKNANR